MPIVILSFLVGVLLPLQMALTTDQIIQKVYDSSNTAFRVNVVAGGGGVGSITSGTTTITSGADKAMCFDDGGVINCADAGLTYDKSTPSLLVGSFVGAYTYVAPEFVQTAASDVTTQAIYDVTVGVGNFAELIMNGSGTGATDLTNQHSSAVLLATASKPLYIVAGDAIKFASGGSATANEVWDIATDGNLIVAVGGGGVMPKAAAIGSAPTCDSSHKGMLATATDCNAGCTQGGSCTTGGAIVCPIYCDGSAWKEH